MTKFSVHWLWDIWLLASECVESAETLTAVVVYLTAAAHSTSTYETVASLLIGGVLFTALLSRFFGQETAVRVGSADESMIEDKEPGSAKLTINGGVHIEEYTVNIFPQLAQAATGALQGDEDVPSLGHRIKAGGGIPDAETMRKVADYFAYLKADKSKSAPLSDDDFDDAVGC